MVTPPGNVDFRGWNVSGVKCTLKFSAFHGDLLQRLHPRKPNLCAEGCGLSIIPVGMGAGSRGSCSSSLWG